MAENLAQEIANYSVQARELENVRLGLVERINTVIKEEIIPQVRPLLSEDLSIIEDESKASILISNSVPSVFNVNLIISYGGGLTYPRPCISEKIDMIQHQLEPKFKEIAEKYGLAEIIVIGKPSSY